MIRDSKPLESIRIGNSVFVYLEVEANILNTKITSNYSHAVTVITTASESSRHVDTPLFAACVVHKTLVVVD
jgi:hypothetical protein